MATRKKTTKKKVAKKTVRAPARIDLRPGARETVREAPRKRKTAGPDPRAVDFFYKHSGYSYDPKKETEDQGRKRGAIDLAKAEQEATARGWNVKWEEDPEGWDSLGDIDPDEVKEMLVAILYDENGRVLGSLGSIVNPDRNYGRVIEAELALEALSETSGRVSEGRTRESGTRETVREAPKARASARTYAVRSTDDLGQWVSRGSIRLRPNAPADEIADALKRVGIFAPRGIDRLQWDRGGDRAIIYDGNELPMVRIDASALRESRVREPRSMEASRIDELHAMLPRGYSVETYSPGDGVTRYRFFENAPKNQDYFGPDSGIHTALGYKSAVTFAQMLGPARRPKKRVRESGTLNERPWVPPSMAAEGITPIMLEVLMYGIGEHADRRRVPAPGDSYIHDRDGYARLQEEGYIVRKHKTQGLSSLGDYYVLTDKGAALWARYRDEARKIATPASRAPKGRSREVNEAPRGRWDGSDANERAYNSVHNGLVNIIIDGPNERSPEILKKAGIVLLDLNRQKPPKRNQTGHDERINRLRRMIHAAEEVMSGRRAPTGDSARGPALREDFDFDADPKKDQRWIVVYDEDAIELMPGWTGGQSDPLYAISSSGGANYAWVIEDAIANLDKDIRSVKKLKGGKFQLGKGTFTKKEIDELHIIRDALQMALDAGGEVREARR